uniref:P22 n=1 Tax=Galleria mellonella TaxID=7137 RepID=A0A3G1T1W1_GALME|nr:P22 [Galleria mellonella]
MADIKCVLFIINLIALCNVSAKPGLFDFVDPFLDSSEENPTTPPNTDLEDLSAIKDLAEKIFKGLIVSPIKGEEIPKTPDFEKFLKDLNKLTTPAPGGKTTPKPDTTTASSGTTTPSSDTTTASSDTTTASSGTTTASPETTTASSDTTTASTATTTPGSVSTTPSGSTTESPASTTPSSPGSKPSKKPKSKSPLDSSIDAILNPFKKVGEAVGSFL